MRKGKQLINLYEVLELFILNCGRQCDWEGRMLFISKAGASLVDYVLCLYGIDIYLKTFSIMDVIVKVDSVVETVKSTIVQVM
jgi:hypothetical protein